MNPSRPKRSSSTPHSVELAIFAQPPDRPSCWNLLSRDAIQVSGAFRWIRRSVASARGSRVVVRPL